MPLALVIDHPSQVHPVLRPEYVRLPNGKWELELVGGLVSALKVERRWRDTVRKMQALHPELRPILAEVEHYLKSNPDHQ